MTAQKAIDSTVTEKGQTTLPKAVREALRLSAGDKVRYFIYGDEVRIAKVRSAMDLAGMLYEPGRKPVTIEEMNEAIARGAAFGEADE
ncbi:MAG: type II toxin-antitoxin system PrlF family antitoxin [Oceanicaulis sp.]